MEDLSMFQRPRTVALEDENPETYGTTLIYPLDRLVSVASWVTRLLILGLASSVDARVSPERVLIYPLDRLVECGFADYMVNIYTWELVAFMGTQVISRSMA
ncbi:hypothetical protein PIB30_039876 [Stylosanthes scabra]|uniref:Uncharacterized protein n=1 Tax=Stylosanthes scabra TaxID=79078 RepID=A0ABU6WHB9_9FABA|nr:hypothetical protein [Stylosanthes scabra]